MQLEIRLLLSFTSIIRPGIDQIQFHEDRGTNKTTGTVYEANTKLNERDTTF